MGSVLFKSRRSTTPAEETARVVEAVSAYYEAGRRPASHETAFESIEDYSDSGTTSEAEQAIVTASGQSLEELADELEALIDSIRYGSEAT
jgi:hypothetical protein